MENCPIVTSRRLHSPVSTSGSSKQPSSASGMAGEASFWQQQLHASITREPRMIGSTVSAMARGSETDCKDFLQRHVRSSRLEKMRALVSPPNRTSRLENTARPVTVFVRPAESVASAMTR